MHIAYIYHVFYPEKFKHYSLEKMMHDVGYDVTIITSNMGEQYDKFINEIPIFKLTTLNLTSNLLGINYPYIFSMKKNLEKLKPDIIHTDSHLFLTTYSAIMNSSQLNIPSIVSVRGFRVERNKLFDMMQEIYLNTIAKKIFEKANIVHCLTYYEAKLVKSLCSFSNTVVIPNFVDTDVFKPSDEKDSNLIVWSGRMVEEKGLLYLLQSMKIVFNEFQHVKLVLIGDGPLRKVLEEYVKYNNLTNNVIFTGWIDREQLASMLSRSSIFVFPSLSEGMPKALLEAMACGNASVVSDIPQIKEVIDDGVDGFHTPSRNYHKMAKLIVQCLQDNNLTRKIASNARKKIEEKYSLDAIRDKYVNMYIKLVE